MIEYRWLMTSQTLMQSTTHPTGVAAVDFYFIQDDGGMFKATMPYEPYFYLTVRVSLLADLRCSGRGLLICCHIAYSAQAGTETIVEEWAVKRFEGLLVRVEREKKWDLDLVSLTN